MCFLLQSQRRGELINKLEDLAKYEAARRVKVSPSIIVCTFVHIFYTIHSNIKVRITCNRND